MARKDPVYNEPVYNLPEPGSDAYLSYSLQDAPDVSPTAYLHSQGKHASWWHLHRYNESDYEAWKQRLLQNYDNYMNAYNTNYNSEASRRLRLEETGFSGQYLANGIGGSMSNPSSLSQGMQGYYGDPNKRMDKGIQRVMQTLELMNNAGVAMKNFGEGRTAMLWSNKLAKEDWRSKFYTASTKGLEYDEKFMLMNDPKEYGYEKGQDGHWTFTGANGVAGRNMRLEAYLNKIMTDEGKVALYDQQQLLNSLTYKNRSLYEESTMKAQKELLEGKKTYQDITNDYAEALKKMGLAAPAIQIALQGLKMFM